ncbi:MAG: hypothetical protein UHE93_07630 [Muribaculaceae bacterium]|nr:hypothetical protein [Muribaculaceae bacterium]
MATINTLIFSSIMMATAVSPLYENPLGEEIIFKRLDSTSISLPPQAVRYEQTINLVYANPEAATVNVYTLARQLIKAFNLRHNYKTYNNQSNYSQLKF